MNLNRSRNSAFSHGFCRLDRIYRVLMKKTSNPTHLSRFLVAETYLRPSWASGQPVFELDRAVWAGGLVLGFPWTSLPNNNHNPVTTQFQGHCLDSNANHNHVVTTQALAFTPDLYQQLLSFIGVHQTSTVQETHMVNAVSLPSNAIAGTISCSPHSVFSAKVVNRKAFGVETWVIDTGATDHIVCSMHLLTSFTTISHSVVELPDGEAALVTHVGTIKLSSHITLTNVLCVPFFSFNLISVSALTHSQPLCLVFLSNYYFIQDLTCWNTIGMGKMHDGLYLLQGSSLSKASKSLDDFLLRHKFSSFTAFSSSVSHANLYSLWHSGLGHPSNMKLHSLVHLFPFLQNCCTKDYTVCPLAKQKRLPFPFDNKRAVHSFDLVHMDVWGPFSISTTARHIYFLTIVDDASRATWVFLMKAKSEVRPLIISF